MSARKRSPQEHIGYQLADGIYAVYNALQVDVARLLTELDLTESLADALWALEPDGRPQPRRALAERLHCDPSNVTFLADRLEERGLVARCDDPADRRVKAIALTRSGMATRERMAAAVAESAAFARLNAGEQKALARLLARCGLPANTTI